jgi:transcription-repair coupling factor (superfamily II helicase)
MQLYRRMGNIAAATEIDALAQELVDRFGPLPAPVENLMFQLHLKVMANQAHLTSIGRDRERALIVLKSEALEHVDRIGLQKRLGGLASVQRREIHLPLNDGWRVELVKVLELMRE